MPPVPAEEGIEATELWELSFIAFQISNGISNSSPLDIALQRSYFLCVFIARKSFIKFNKSSSLPPKPSSCLFSVRENSWLFLGQQKTKL